MHLVHKVFRSFGLRLNCNHGKTEAVVQYRGTGAPRQRQARFVDDRGWLDIPDHDPLHLVPHYVHLGIVQAQSCDIQQDLKMKLGKAASAYRCMSKTLFHNRKVSIAVRLKLFDTLILPILLYGCGSWPLLSTRQFASLNSAITKWQRRIVGDGFWQADQTSDAAFRAFWRIPPLAVRLAKHRLLFLLQLHRHSPQVVWDFITAEDEFCRTSWLDAVRHGLRWFHSMQPDAGTQEYHHKDSSCS